MKCRASAPAAGKMPMYERKCIGDVQLSWRNVPNNLRLEQLKRVLFMLLLGIGGCLPNAN